MIAAIGDRFTDHGKQFIPLGCAAGKRNKGPFSRPTEYGAVSGFDNHGHPGSSPSMTCPTDSSLAVFVKPCRVMT